MKRVWHKGPPPHVGWWNASNNRYYDIWRWWDGFSWSLALSECSDIYAVRRSTSARESMSVMIEWTDYYPENARVPRIDPRSLK